MSFLSPFIAAFILFSPLEVQSAQKQTLDKETLEVVEFVDIESYMGTWYEIARLPQRFQRNCLGTKANYKLHRRDRVRVTNSCINARNPEDIRTASGLGRIVDNQTNAKL